MRSTFRRLPALLTAVLLCGALGGVPALDTDARAAADGELAADLEKILGDARLTGAHASVMVRDAATGEVVYSRNSTTRLLPASNEKLLTSTAALDVLGPDHRFSTRVSTDGTRRGPALQGDLYLKGTGDPTMLAADYDALAAQVAATGATVVRGRLVADDSWFDDVPLGTDWAWDDEPFYYAAPVSALTVAPNEDFDAGSVIVEVRPGTAAGQPAKITVVPETTRVRIDDRAVTGASGSAAGVSVERRHGTETVVVSGSIPLGGATVQEWSSVADPTAYAADVFRTALRRHGVRLAGRTAQGSTPAGARELAHHDSATLAQIATPFLKLSNNGHAEVLIKSMGRKVRGEGSWPAGLQVLGDYLRRTGVDTQTVRTRDGSGLSRANHISTEQLSRLLLAVRDKSWYRTWYDALPIAGQADRMVGGTLRSRMQGTTAAGNVHAKTGSLTGVSALSGYVTTAGGRPLVFSIVLNNYLASSVKDIEDTIAVRLADIGGPAAATSRLRQAPPAVKDDPATTVDESGLECSWVKAC